VFQLQFERNKIVSKEENKKLMYDIYNEFVYEDKKIENFETRFKD